MESSLKIIRDNWIPTPPTADGDWRDKGRDHDYFQFKVSLAAQLGGVSANTGCPTREAAAARDYAEQAYYRQQEIHTEQILIGIKI